MPSPRVTIDELPEKVTPAGTEFLVIQDGVDTKKMLTSAIIVAGGPASGVTLTPTGTVAATNVQTGIAELASEKVQGGAGINEIVALSQAAYDALGVKVATTLYVINS